MLLAYLATPPAVENIANLPIKPMPAAPALCSTAKMLAGPTAPPYTVDCTAAATEPAVTPPAVNPAALSITGAAATAVAPTAIPKA